MCLHRIKLAFGLPLLDLPLLHRFPLLVLAEVRHGARGREAEARGGRGAGGGEEQQREGEMMRSRAVSVGGVVSLVRWVCWLGM